MPVFFNMPNVPVFCNVLWPDRAAAQRCERGDIKLAWCPQTGLIRNIAFEPARLHYTEAYENALDFSPLFQGYIRSLAAHLVQRHHLYRKDIIEIGCGQGHFLRLLCQLGDNRGSGFDPTYAAPPEAYDTGGYTTFIRDYYDERYAHYPGDFICCRHTLEHLPDPTTFLHTLRQAIGHPRTVVFFEVPNALYTFRHLAIWDLIYEHCCYFAPVALASVFTACGFGVHHLAEAYDGQFLCLEARASAAGATVDVNHQAEQIQQLSQEVASFQNRFDRKLSTWQQKLAALHRAGKRAVVWGAGSKGVTFLNLLAPWAPIDYVVDIHPRKADRYIPGTGQRIVPPAFLQTYQPDVVLIMNPIYTDEIRAICRELKIAPELIGV
jgi:trans-aconitate methyltransferase